LLKNEDDLAAAIYRFIIVYSFIPVLNPQVLYLVVNLY